MPPADDISAPLLGELIRLLPCLPGANPQYAIGTECDRIEALKVDKDAGIIDAGKVGIGVMPSGSDGESSTVGFNDSDDCSDLEVVGRANETSRPEACRLRPVGNVIDFCQRDSRLH